MSFSTKHLLAATTAVAIGGYALVYATPVWGKLTYTLSISMLLAAVVFAAILRGGRQAFWLGFAIFGRGYWLLVSSPTLIYDTGPNTWRIQSGHPLASSIFLDLVYFRGLSIVHKQPTFDASGVVTNGSRYPNDINFGRVGHSLFDLLTAYAGGVLGAFAYRRSGREKASEE